MIFLTYIRSIIALFIVTLVTIVFSVVMLLLSLFPRSESWVLKVPKIWCQIVLKLYSVKVKYKGLDRLNSIQSGGGILIFNHSSLFDIPAIFLMPINFKISFGAKAELFKIPFFSLAMKKMGVLPIARGNREKVFNLYKENISKLKEGLLLSLAPEGGRSRTKAIRPFKAGPFVFAIEAKVPVVCVYLKGAREILPPGHFFANIGSLSRTIEVNVIDVVSTDAYDLNSRKELQIKLEEQFKKY